MNKDKELELKRAKEDLEDLETYVEEFTSFLPIAVCTVNPIGIIINVNAAFENMTGYSTIDGIGQEVVSFFENPDSIDALLRRLKDGDVFSQTAEAILEKKDGSKITVHITASSRSNRSDQFLGYFLGMNDITELKSLQDSLEEQVEERTKSLNARKKELEESHAKLEKAYEEVKKEREKTLSVVSNLTDGLVFVNSDGVIELMNPHAESLLRVKARDVVGEYLVEEDEGGMGKLVSLTHDGNTQISREKVELPGEQHVEVSIVPVIAQRKTLGSLIVLHDISREKALEELKVEFVSVAAHQMRTPLSAVKWAFELLLSSEDELPEKFRKIAANGFESTQRVLKIVNNFLNVGAIESTNVDYTFAPVDLGKVVENIFSEVSIEAEEKGVQLTFAKKDKQLPYIKADQEKFNLVMQSLIENALKYTMERGTVMVDAVQRGDDMLISIKDSGIGIPEAEQDNIFTKFYRADNARKVETDGNGLGLYITKRIVEKHGGTIWFESYEGKGTTFYFTIPLHTQQQT